MRWLTRAWEDALVEDAERQAERRPNPSWGKGFRQPKKGLWQLEWAQFRNPLPNTPHFNVPWKLIGIAVLFVVLGHLFPHEWAANYFMPLFGMAQLPLNYGNGPNDHLGAPLRTLFANTHSNFSDLYARQSRTISAGEERFSAGATTEARIQLAVNQANLELAGIVEIPLFMLPFNITLIDLSVFTAAGRRLTREGGDPSVFDPWAYGASHDGITLDTASVQACASAAVGRGAPVYLSGTFLAVSPTFDSDIIGSGTLKLPAGAASGSSCAILGGTDHQVQGVHFDGNDQAASMGLRLINATRTKIIAAQFQGCRRGALKLGTNAIDTTVVASTFTNPGYGILYDDALSGSADTGGSGLTVKGCTLYGDSGSTSVPGDGIELNAPQGGFQNIEIIGNRIHNYWSSAADAGIGIGLAGCSRGNVTGNTVTGCTHDGIHVEEATGGAFAAFDLTIEANVVVTCGIGTVKQSGITVRYGRVDVINNTVVSCGASGIAFNTRSTALATSLTTAGMRVSGNTCRLNGSHGIVILGAQRMNVVGNTCVDNAQTVTTCSGITFNNDSGSQGCTSCLVTGNTISGASHFYAIDVNTSAGADIFITQNVLFAGGTGVIRMLAGSCFYGPNAQIVVLLNGAAVNVTPDAPKGDLQQITVTDNAAFTVNNVTNAGKGQRMTFDVYNNSGGAMGAITWNAAFKLAGAFTNPATGQHRLITFERDGAGAWREVNRSAADQAN